MTERVFSISWRYKLLLLGVLPAQVAVGCIALAGFTLHGQSNAVHDALQASKERQLRATDTLTSILSLQRNMQTLIAAEEPPEIRQHAVAAIASSSALDEAIQRLEEALPGSQQVNELKNGLTAIHPLQLQVLSLARDNADTEALAVVKDTAAQAAAILELARSILAAEQAALQALAEDNQRDAQRVVLTLAGIAGAGLVIAIVAALIFARWLLTPLQALQRGMGAFAKGNLAVAVTYHSDDEVGRTVAAFHHAVSATREIVQRIHAEGGSLSDKAGRVANASTASSRQAEQVQKNTTAVLEQIGILVDISDQVETRLRQSTDEAERSSRESELTSDRIAALVNQFAEFRTEMSRLSEGIDNLSRSATTIGTITQTIRSVSEQTNLLALNAAIEAARAGEQGRGFAVVADEVRSLARRSGEAVEEISDLAAAMATSVASAVAGVDTAVGLTQRNVEGLEQAAETMRTASRASDHCRNEIVAVQNMIHTHRSAIEDIRSFIHQLGSLAEVTTESVQDLDNLASSLGESSAALTAAVAHFKQQSRNDKG